MHISNQALRRISGTTVVYTKGTGNEIHKSLKLTAENRSQIAKEVAICELSQGLPGSEGILSNGSGHFSAAVAVRLTGGCRSAIALRDYMVGQFQRLHHATRA
jgi:hypothetical protein